MWCKLYLLFMWEKSVKVSLTAKALGEQIWHYFEHEMRENQNFVFDFSWWIFSVMKTKLSYSCFFLCVLAWLINYSYFFVLFLSFNQKQVFLNINNITVNTRTYSGPKIEILKLSLWCLGKMSYAARSQIDWKTIGYLVYVNAVDSSWITQQSNPSDAVLNGEAFICKYAWQTVRDSPWKKLNGQRGLMGVLKRSLASFEGKR